MLCYQQVHHITKLHILFVSLLLSWMLEYQISAFDIALYINEIVSNLFFLLDFLPQNFLHCLYFCLCNYTPHSVSSTLLLLTLHLAHEPFLIYPEELAWSLRHT